MKWETDDKKTYSWLHNFSLSRLLDSVKPTNSFDDESFMHEKFCSLLLLPATVTIIIWKANVCCLGHAMAENLAGERTNRILHLKL